MTLKLSAIVEQTIAHAEHDYNRALDFLDTQLKELANNFGAINNLGLMFYKNIHYDLACRCFYNVLSLDNTQYRTHNNLGLTLNRFGNGAKAVDHYTQALNCKADYHPARSNLAYALLYFGETGRDEILQAHKAIDQNVFLDKKSFINMHNIDLNPNRRLNIGYVSSDFRNHAVGRFLQGVFENHDTQAFQIHAFDNRANNTDETAQKLKQNEIRWHQIADTSTEQCCKLITANKIDILIDLSGHTSGGRPDVFSQRVAPVQMTYLGYPSTSGLANMDYRIGDEFADLTEFEKQNSETMLRLPHSMWNYQPWPDMPEVSANPFQENKEIITFGSANNHAKIQREWLEVWAKVLATVPNSVFKIKSRALRNPDTARDLVSFFSDRGVSNDRIHIEHYSPTRLGHWQTLSSFDIALDTFPYNGTTTSCDLLWLGVPIITKAGQSHVSRTTASILQSVGLESWVAYSDAEFIDLCQQKANNLDELRKHRQSLRHRFKSSSLGHAPLFMSEYEALLRTAWKTSVKNISTN